jgi:hypothetical protein
MMARSTPLQLEAGYIDARPLTAGSSKSLATHGRTIHWVNRRGRSHGIFDNVVDGIAEAVFRKGLRFITALSWVGPWPYPHPLASNISAEIDQMFKLN